MIRLARGSDMKWVHRIENRAFGPGLRWNLADLVNKQKQGQMLVYQGSQEVFGYSVMRVRDGTGIIDSVAVHPAYQGNGIGKQLVEATLNRMLGKCDGCELDCDVELIPFYTKFGFAVRGYYLAGFGAKQAQRVVMGKEFRG